MFAVAGLVHCMYKMFKLNLKGNIVNLCLCYPFCTKLPQFVVNFTFSVLSTLCKSFHLVPKLGAADCYNNVELLSGCYVRGIPHGSFS